MWGGGKLYSHAIFLHTSSKMRTSISIPNGVHLLALIYQTSIETSAESGIKISPRKIHDIRVSDQFHRTIEPLLIKVAAENNSCLNNKSLFIHGLICLTS